MRRNRGWVLIALAAGCGEPAPAPQVGPVVAQVIVSPAVDTLTALGQTVQFSAVARDSTGAALAGQTFTWTSSIPSLAKIDAVSGVATALGNGPLTVTATHGSVSATASLVVSQVPTRLVFDLQPAATAERMPFQPPVLVDLNDARGNLVLRGTDSVSLVLLPNAGGARLLGADAVQAAAGIANFNAVAVDRAGGGYRFIAASGSLPSDTSVAFDVSPGTAYSSLTVGGSHACGIAIAGPAYCWGSNTNGQLGDGTTVSHSNPGLVTVPAGIALTAISAGTSHTCGVSGGGGVYCWGLNADGQVGDGTTTFAKPSPVAIASPAGVSFTAVSAGGAHSCAIATTGAPYCWGRDSLGQVGDSTFALRRATPTPVAMQGRLTTLISAGIRHTCAVANGSAMCWGSFDVLQLGFTPGVPARSYPGFISSQKTFLTIAASELHSCGVVIGGETYCWGLDPDGELGNSDPQGRTFPIPVEPPSGVAFIDVAVGLRHTCGVTADSATYCWGKNDQQQLGNGTTSGAIVPKLVVTPKNVRFNRVRAGGNGTCALTPIGGVYCWGNGIANPTPVGPPK